MEQPSFFVCIAASAKALSYVIQENNNAQIEVAVCLNPKYLITAEINLFHLSLVYHNYY